MYYDKSNGGKRRLNKLQLLGVWTFRYDFKKSKFSKLILSECEFMNLVIVNKARNDLVNVKLGSANIGSSNFGSVIYLLANLASWNFTSVNLMIANIVSSNFTIVNLASSHFLSENSTREI